MALANVGVFLAKWRKKVLLVDWDLEAPGLHYFFKRFTDVTGVESTRGLVDILTELLNDEVDDKRGRLDWASCVTSIIVEDNTSLDLIGAGIRDEEYFGRVRRLDFNKIYDERDGGFLIETLRDEWKREYDFVLVDSRTGVTDAGGICTIQLPDLLVLFFTATEQSFDGTVKIAERALEAQTNLPVDRYNLVAIPIPSRFENSFEFEAGQEWLSRFADGLLNIYSNWLPKTISPRIFLEKTKQPYIPYFSFGEKLAAVELGTADTALLGYAYENLASLINHGLEDIDEFVENRDAYVKRATQIKVFISYSHDSLEHDDRVLALANRLRSEGIDTILDQYNSDPPEGWPLWMDRQIRNANFVLMVCTETYYKRVMGEEQGAIGLGVRWEGNLGHQHLYDKESMNTRFIPVLFTGSKEEYIPTLVRGVTHYYPDTPPGYEDLYRRLTNQPKVERPALSKLKPLPPRERLTNFIRPNNIPAARNPYFVGREDILSAVHASLQLSHVAASKPLAISGLAGVGKTQTAIEYAYRYWHEYTALLWVHSASEESIVDGFVGLARLLDIPEKDEQDQRLAVNAVLRWLDSNDGWLLIFDNADDPALIESFLPRRLRGHILLTSRALVLDVIGMDSVEILTLKPNEARVFLTGRTGRANPDGDELKAIEELSLTLGYLPLALEQAGAYIVQMQSSFRNYLSVYKKRGLSLLEKMKPKAGEYPGSVATTLLLNFAEVERVSPASADLLRVSAFLSPEKIPFELITGGARELGLCLRDALADDDRLAFDKVLEPLAQLSLVLKSPGPGTYDLYPLVQQMLRDTMDESSRRTWTERSVRAVNKAFPTIEVSSWPTCERLLRHALACAVLIDENRLEFEEAGQLLNQVGCYLSERARYAKAEPLFRRALEIEEKVLGSYHSDVADCFNNLAGLYRNQGKYAEAEPLYKGVLEIREKILGPEHPDVAQSLDNLAGLYRNQGKYAEAEPLYKRVLEIREKILGPEHPDVAQSLDNLAGLYRNQGKYAEAEPLYKRVLEIYERVLGPDHPEIAARISDNVVADTIAHKDANAATTLNNLGSAWHNLGDAKKAIEYYTKALEIDRTIFGDAHPDVARDLNNLGSAWSDLGDAKKAIECLTKALEIDRVVFGDAHPDVAIRYNNLGGAWSALGDAKKAIGYYTKALEIDLAVFGDAHPTVAIRYNNLGGAWWHLGDAEKAIEYFTKALEIDRAVFGDAHPDVARDLNNLGSAWSDLGDAEKAIGYYTKALEIDRAVFGDAQHPTVAIDLNNLGSAWSHLGDAEKAIEYFTKALEIFTHVYGGDHPSTMRVKKNLEVAQG